MSAITNQILNQNTNTNPFLDWCNRWVNPITISIAIIGVLIAVLIPLLKYWWNNRTKIKFVNVEARVNIGFSEADEMNYEISVSSVLYNGCPGRTFSALNSYLIINSKNKKKHDIVKLQIAEPINIPPATLSQEIIFKAKINQELEERIRDDFKYAIFAIQGPDEKYREHKIKNMPIIYTVGDDFEIS